MSWVLTPSFETASAADLDVIRAVLAEGGLPSEDVDQHLAEFILAKWENTTIGTVAAEYAEEAALLRSLCVVPRYRGQAIGARLLAAAEAKAASRGVREIYLLTTSSAAFFEHHGFVEVARAKAPAGVHSTRQFRMLCPATAICMCKSLVCAATHIASVPECDNC